MTVEIENNLLYLIFYLYKNISPLLHLIWIVFSPFCPFYLFYVHLLHSQSISKEHDEYTRGCT